MKNPLRRTLSFFLAFVLAFSPLTTAAEGQTEEPEELMEEISEAPDQESVREDESLILSEDALGGIIASGTSGENVTWVLDSDGLLSISGFGAMPDYGESAPAPWEAQKEAITKVVINRGITTIGAYAFCECTKLFSAAIPDTVTAIGNHAFPECQIDELYIDDVASWLSITFEDDTANPLWGDRWRTLYVNGAAISELVIPEGITEIPQAAFSGCIGLTSVTIPEGAVSIGNYAFYGSGLTEVTMPDSIQRIGHYAFYSCDQLTCVTIPKNVECIAEGGFSCCSNLKEIRFTGDLPGIRAGAFQNITATAYYPEGNASFSDAGQYGGELTWVPYTVETPSIIDSGTCGKNVRWALDDTGTLTLSGTGSTYDWKSYDSKAPWYDYRENLLSVFVEEGITALGYGAFEYCYKLQSVTLPDSLTSLGDSCFFYCQALGSIHFGSGLTSIGELCFAHNSSLKGVELPSGLSSLSRGCFWDTGLESIVIPDGVTALPDQCLSDCFRLKTVVLPEGLTSLGDYCFSYAVANSINLPESLTYIGDNCFRYGNYPSLRLSEKVSHIGTGNFVGCTKLVLEVDSKNACYTMENGMLMDTARTTVIRMLDTTVKSLGGNVDASVFPASVTKLAPYSFAEIHGLKTITLPEGITILADRCFDACWDLQEIVIPDSVAYMGEMCFYFCRAMKDFTIPGGVTRLEENVLRSCEGLTEITIPAGITSIGKGAFSLCKNLNTVRFEGDTPIMNSGIFEGVTANAYYPGGAGSWNASTMQNYGGNITWMPYTTEVSTIVNSGSCGENLTWQFTLDGTLTISGTGFMDNYEQDGSWISSAPWEVYRSQIKAIVIGERVASVGDFAFWGCISVQQITIPQGIISIGGGAFESCTALTNVTIPGNVKSIGSGAFGCCTNLTEVTIEEGVQTIGSGAFLYSSVTSVSIPGTVVSIGEEAFSCTGLTALFIPEGLRYIGKYAFSDCADLKTIVLPDSVTYIGGEAFAGCSGLTSFHIPSNVTFIGELAFLGCSNIATFQIPKGVTTIGAEAFAYCSNLKDLYFTGEAPAIGENAFREVHATVFYPDNLSSWSDEVFQNYGGELSWVPYTPQTPPEDAASICVEISQAYLLLSIRDTTTLTANRTNVQWESENPAIATVTDGVVTAVSAGTTYITASAKIGGAVYAARCRVDVTDDAVSSEAFRNGITLVTDKVTTELYHTDYTRIAFAVNLTQNMTVFAEGTGENTGHAVRSARFYDSAAAQCFDLRVADDRTLEIIPTAYAIANPKAVKNVKSAILLDVDGSLFITSPLTLTVKKTLPTIKAKAVKINNFCCDRAALTFTGGNVVSVEPNGAMPEGFGLDGLNVFYVLGGSRASANLNLLAEVEGLAVKRPVTVSVSVTRTEPAVKLSASSVTLLPDSLDKAEITLNQTEDLEITVLDSAKNPTEDIRWTLDGSKLTFFAPDASAAGKTYKCYVNVSGSSKKAALTIKISSAKPALTLKASGSIDTAIPNSPVTLTAKLSNYHAGSGEAYTLKVTNAGEDVTELFCWEPKGAVLTVTAAGEIPKGTYTALISVDLNGDGTADCEKSVKLPVKWSDPAKVPVSVTLKAKGSIDVIRPGTAVTITPAIKNWFGCTPSENDLVFYKNKLEITENVPFTVEIVDGCYVISNNGADSSAKYTVSFKADIGGKEIISKPISLPVKMASAKVTQDVKTVTLLKNDRYDSKTVELTAPEGTEIEKIGYSSDFFTVTPLGQNRYSISFKDNRPAPKSQTLKLSVFLEGNLTAKPNATLSVKVNLK